MIITPPPPRCGELGVGSALVAANAPLGSGHGSSSMEPLARHSAPSSALLMGLEEHYVVPTQSSQQLYGPSWSKIPGISSLPGSAVVSRSSWIFRR